MTEPTTDERIEELRDSCFTCNRSKRYHNLVPHPFIVNPALAIIDELKARKVNPHENAWDAAVLYFPIWSKP